jgi:hypothetical protein
VPYLYVGFIAMFALKVVAASAFLRDRMKAGASNVLKPP